MFDVKPLTSPIENDCGATCLKMLLDFYGIESDLETLTSELGINVWGCSMKDLRNVGLKYGLDSKCYKMDYEELLRQDRPSIIWWKCKHFCVLCGLDENDNVVVCNPDLGRYRMPIAFFKMFYSGIALFNGEPIDTEIMLIPQRISEVETVAEMAYVNSEISLALLEMEI